MHQGEGVQRAWDLWKLLSLPHYLFLFEMGTGKTLTMVALMRLIFEAHQKALKTLILCPTIVVKNWESEITKFSLCGRYVQLLRGSKQKRIRDFEAGERAGKKIFVTNIEALATSEGLLWEKKERGKSVIKRPLKRGWEMLIIDEAHRLKTPGAVSTKMAYKIADQTYFKYLLTGSPIAKNEMDLWSLFRLLDGGATFGKNFGAFKREWFTDLNAGMPTLTHFPSWQIKPGSAEKMTALVYKKAMRVEKEECLDLPPLIKTVVEVGMSPLQRKAYEEMKRDFITYLNGAACTATLAIVKALRLAQIASGFAKTEDGTETHFADAPRLNALADLLEDSHQKVIVWAAFRENYKAIAEVCKKLGRSVAFITGEQNQKEKDQAELDFTKGAVQTLISNPAAGGTGVNLIEAPVAIWYSRSFNSIHRWQAIARNHRGGSEMHAKVTMFDLVAEGSIEQRILKSLDDKEEIAEAILSWKDGA